VSPKPVALVRRVIGSLFRSRARQEYTTRADTAWRVQQVVNHINHAHWQARQAMRAEAARWQHQDDGWS